MILLNLNECETIAILTNSKWCYFWGPYFCSMCVLLKYMKEVIKISSQLHTIFKSLRVPQIYNEYPCVFNDLRMNYLILNLALFLFI